MNIEEAKGWLSALDKKSEYEAISKEMLLQYIDQLENKVKELECDNHNKENKIIEQETFLQMATEVIKNSLLKQVIRDKIEELKKQCGGNVFHIQQTLNAEIRLLQELLEEK